jgi:protein arginine N-methyltransferase 1
MYSVSDYGKMIDDQVRMEAHLQALRQVIKQDTIVLDIGTGTGIFALLACQIGAHKVYAIEPDNVIQLAQEIAAANGYGDRITFIQGISTRVALPEKADVIIADLRGVLPLFSHHIPSIVDARQRWLTPGGTLIPKRDTLWVAVVEASDLYNLNTRPWNSTRYGLNMSAARQVVLNTWRKARVRPEQLLLPPVCWAALDYESIENPNVSGEVEWTATQAGTAHGLVLWFEATLAEGVHISNAPQAPEMVYGNAFLPWLEPVEIAAGDNVSVSLHADLVGENYVWRWETRILHPGIPTQPKADFRQSTFLGRIVTPNQLHKRANNYTPVLDEDGHIDQVILGLMSGDNTLDDIAQLVSAQFPTRFSDWQDAIEHVRKLSAKYSQ